MVQKTEVRKHGISRCQIQRVHFIAAVLENPVVRRDVVCERIVVVSVESFFKSVAVGIIAKGGPEVPVRNLNRICGNIRNIALSVAFLFFLDHVGADYGNDVLLLWSWICFTKICETQNRSFARVYSSRVAIPFSALPIQAILPGAVKTRSSKADQYHQRNILCHKCHFLSGFFNPCIRSAPHREKLSPAKNRVPKGKTTNRLNAQRPIALPAAQMLRSVFDRIHPLRS